MPSKSPNDGATKCMNGDYGPRTLLRLTGADAVTFLHNLCTQDIRAMRPGDCAEAFITNVQGKTLGYVRVFREAEGLLLDSSPGQAQTLLEHFDKYQIREKISFEDLSHSAQAFVADWDSFATYLMVENEDELSDRSFKSNKRIGETIAARWEIAGPGTGYGIFVDGEAKSKWNMVCGPVQNAALSDSEVQARRIAAGTVEFGSDVTSENLPQEINRDAQAISFKKGCYLGQETVARIDALGHVNRLLVRLRGEGKLAISASDPITVEGKQIGHITSAAYWESKNESWALGFVRRGNHATGTEVTVNDSRLQVVG